MDLPCPPSWIDTWLASHRCGPVYTDKRGARVWLLWRFTGGGVTGVMGRLSEVGLLGLVWE
jgi:hypothetical protein